MDIIADRIIDFLEGSGYCDAEVFEFYQELIDWCEERIRAMKGE